MNHPRTPVRSFPLTFKMLATLLAVAFTLAACAGAGWRQYQIDGSAEAIVERQKQLEKPALDLSQVTVVRLKSGEQRYEVTSIAPLVLKTWGFGWGRAKSLMSLDETRQNLRLFTYDVRRGKAYQTSLPLSELQPGKTFSFPMLGEDGFATNMQFTVEQIIVK